MDGVANLMALRVTSKCVMMKMFRQVFTGIKMEWCHVADLAIISLLFTDPHVPTYIVLQNLDVANFRLQKVGVYNASMSVYIMSVCIQNIARRSCRQHVQMI